MNGVNEVNGVKGVKGVDKKLLVLVLHDFVGEEIELDAGLGEHLFGLGSGVIFVGAHHALDATVDDEHRAHATGSHAAIERGTIQRDAEFGGLADGVLLGVYRAHAMLRHRAVFVHCLLELVAHLIAMGQTLGRAHVARDQNLAVADHHAAASPAVASGSFTDRIGNFHKIFVPRRAYMFLFHSVLFKNAQKYEFSGNPLPNPKKLCRFAALFLSVVQEPLAEILRPRTLDAYVGQEHLMGKGAVLRNAIENNNIQSMIFWGPPGVGKTTLALLIAELTQSEFHMLSAISSGVKDIREVIERAKKSPHRSLLFIDEIHRFSKAQQDSLLGAVEKGVVTLIGATTENPSFEVISPLLSRCQVYVLKPLSRDNLEAILKTAVAYLEKQLSCKIKLEDTEALLRISGGDARKLINAIELVTWMTQPVDGVVTITHEQVVNVIQQNLAMYDKNGEQHYDIISAFIKSMRGSDPNAAVYWMARMLVAGEDPLFIARRMVILASEDIGNANPNALLLANNCFQAVNVIGMPEGRIPLSQTAIYLACSPKSNAAIIAIDNAYALVKQAGDLPVPLHIRNAPTNLMKELGYHKGYQYAHDFENNFVNQEFMPEGLQGVKIYEPQNNPRENELRKYLRNCWKEKYKY